MVCNDTDKIILILRFTHDAFKSLFRIRYVYYDYLTETGLIVIISNAHTLFSDRLLADLGSNGRKGFPCHENI